MTEPEIALTDALARYRAHQERTDRIMRDLQAVLRRDGRGVQPRDRVRLVEHYDEHPGNVGDRTGMLLRRGTGDWDGFMLVDFTASGGRKHWVPDSAVVPA